MITLRKRRLMMEALLIMVVYPLAVFILSFIGYVVTKKLFLFPIITFALFFLLALLVHGIEFFSWTAAFTVLSITAALLAKIIFS
ncbi:DUF2651 family protein [Metabacillus lacus]|nr:DUF2651 family protein [Metabacillus lacus]